MVTVPLKASRQYSKPTATLHILKTLEFSSQTLRSGVVVQASDGPPGTAQLFIRGAPAIIADLVQPSSLPVDFDQVLFVVCCNISGPPGGSLALPGAVLAVFADLAQSCSIPLDCQKLPPPPGSLLVVCTTRFDAAGVAGQ